jgi:hypothetical protein
MLRLSILIASALVCATTTALAQTEGRISVGASVTHNATTDGDVASATGFGPLVRLTWTVAPRVAIVGFGGYLINRPGVVYRNRLGQELRDRWKADAVVLSVGAVYSLF